jgi:histidine triad (HIT) family protein
MNCLFCDIDIRSKNFLILKETSNLWIVLDKFPISKGHLLIISKKHYKNLSELDENSWNEILPSVKEIIKKISSIFNPLGFNFISNMNEISYQSIFHFHFHLIPKYRKEEGFIWNTNSIENSENLLSNYSELLDNL